MQTINVTSDPAEADVIINSNRVGKTPIKYQIRRGEDVLIEINKPGYRTTYRQLSRTLSKRGIMDVVGGSFCLFPFFGLLGAGAWEYQPSAFGVILDRKSEETD